MHLGHARTALITWLRARSVGGKVVMRIDDLDPPRTQPGATDAICRDMTWLGLDWDEGPDGGGEYGPYRQSERAETYRAAISALEKNGHLYECSCTRKELATIARAPHETGPVYPGTCRKRGPLPGRPTSLRFAMPDPSPGFVDLHHGPVDPGTAPGDFIVRRSDGIVAYHLATVVDDAAMQISEVLRGDDLLGSTPCQIALYEALGLPVPAFAHVPLVLGADGQRLAKRHRSTAIADYRAAGGESKPLIGWLAHSLGLMPSGGRTSPRQLVSAFDLASLPAGPVSAKTLATPPTGGP